MGYIVLPVQRVLLEYVLKLGKVIFFPAVIDDEIEESSLISAEKEILRGINSSNSEIFREFLSDCSFVLMEVNYTEEQLSEDVNIMLIVLEEANKAFDYVRIQECLFSRPEYLIGEPGVLDGERCYFQIDNKGRMKNMISVDRIFYLMQPGLGLDLNSKEFDDPVLYSVIYSNRIDEVYLEYRTLIADACNAMRILDTNRCFVYLFSKIDRMGHCKSYSFMENKIRIIACVAEEQQKFDRYSNQYFFYSKEIRTEIVHKGYNILEYVPIKKAYQVINDMFKLIIDFCSAIINAQIISFNDLEDYICDRVSRFIYNKPKTETDFFEKISELVGKDSVYVVELQNVIIKNPIKRGDILFLPSNELFPCKIYYENYIKKDLGEASDAVFQEFSVEEMEYILEIIKHKDVRKLMSRDPIAIGTHLLKLEDSDYSPIKSQILCDYVCGEVDKGLYYDVLKSGTCFSTDILPPKSGIYNGIRAIRKYDEYEDSFSFFPGSVYSGYHVPDVPFCVDEIPCEISEALYNVLYDKEEAEISAICRNALERLCESYYYNDWTTRISYLFDIMDGLYPKSFDGSKLMKQILVHICSTYDEYITKESEHEQVRFKYRNPILHGGRSVWEIEKNISEIKRVAILIESTIVNYCVAMKENKILTWADKAEEYKNCQIKLGIIKG